VITPDSPDRQYSTRLRTAVVLTGTGTAGAYHAGVLRALHEAGVRIDLLAGRGIGSIGALFAAIDGGPRLWEKDGVWKRPTAGSAYAWRRPLRIAGGALIAAAGLLALPLALFGLGVLVALVGALLALVSLDRASIAVTAAYARWLDWRFAPTAIPTVIPRLVVLCLIAAIVALGAAVVINFFRHAARRRERSGLLWRLLGAPLSAEALESSLRAELWSLIRGAAPIGVPAPAELGRKYVELLAENLGQPGFRELLIVAHDLDARRDLVFGLLSDAHRARFFTRPVLDGPRQAEAFDLAGVARDHAYDALAASLTVPVATEPRLVSFPPEGPWRGETHRVCDRPGALTRLIEEVGVAGAEQVIILSAAPPPGRPHELSAGRADLRGRTGEQLTAFETAALRDVMEQFGGRFAGIYLVRPVHNPLGPLDFAGVYDERSDRRHSLAELVDRGYEDGYRQFVEPIVAVSGERMQVR
jgi:hypothetical protein